MRHCCDVEHWSNITLNFDLIFRSLLRRKLLETYDKISTKMQRSCDTRLVKIAPFLGRSKSVEKLVKIFDQFRQNKDVSVTLELRHRNLVENRSIFSTDFKRICDSSATLKIV